MKTATLKFRFTGLSVLALLVLLFGACEKNSDFHTDLALDNETIIVPKDSITSKVIVYSDTNWKVELENPEMVDWLSLSPDEPVASVTGKGRDYFQFTAKTNLSGEIRYGTLVIATQSSKKTLVIRQNR